MIQEVLLAILVVVLVLVEIKLTKQQYLLTCLAEECAEVAQMCSKSMRFGLDETKQGLNETNAERLFVEFVDLCTVMGLIIDGYCDKLDTSEKRMVELQEKKLEKIKKYLDYSQKIGIVKID